MKSGARTWLATPALAVLVTAAPARSANDLQALFASVPPPSAALGGADAAGWQDAAAAVANPGALALLPATGLLLDHHHIAPGLNVERGAFAWRSLSRPLGVALRGLVNGRDGVPSRDAIALPRPPESGTRGGLAFGFAPGHGVGLGFAVDHCATLPAETERRTGWSVDAGALWRNRSSAVGVVLRGQALAGLDGARGVVSVAAAQSLGSRARVALQLDSPASGSASVGGGAAMTVVRGLELRAGARDETAGTVFTGGLGIGGDGARIDWAVRAGADRRTEHQLGVVLAFGPRRDLAASKAHAESREAEDRSAPAPAGAKPALDEPPPAAPRAARPAPQDPPVAARLVVRAGPFPSLELAAREVARLYRAALHPEMQQQGDKFFVVVGRATTQKDAEAWRERAARAGVRCRIDAEPPAPRPER